MADVPEGDRRLLQELDDAQRWALRDAHGCGTCKTDAWFICSSCHEGLLSRQCPVCRGEYASEVLYPFPVAALARENSDIRNAATRQVLAVLLEWGESRAAVPVAT